MRALSAILFFAFVLHACDREGGGLSPREKLVLSEQQEEYVTIDGVDFPKPVSQAPSTVREAYVFAAKHPEVLQYMPCYCGCEREVPPHHTPAHASNYDCFVDQIDRSGERPRVDVDAMGFG